MARWNWRQLAHSIREKVLQYVAEHPWESATQIAHGVKSRPGVVSSCLFVLAEQGMVDRKPGCGPRGGTGYKLRPQPVPRKPGRPWFERLDTVISGPD